MLYALIKEGPSTTNLYKTQQTRRSDSALVLTQPLACLHSLQALSARRYSVYMWIVNICILRFHQRVGIAISHSAGRLLHKGRDLQDCLTRRGCSQLVQSWRSILCVIIIWPKTTPFTGSTIDCLAYPLRISVAYLLHLPGYKYINKNLNSVPLKSKSRPRFLNKNAIQLNLFIMKVVMVFFFPIYAVLGYYFYIEAIIMQVAFL